MAVNQNVETRGAHSVQNKSVRHFLPIAARFLMGLIFLVFGLNLFLMFIPPPPTPMPVDAMAFLGALMKTGYMMKLVGATQVIVGVLLLSNRFVPLALALIAPVIVNIICFHAFLQPPGIVPGTVAAILEIYLAWVYRDSFKSMLLAHAPIGS